MSTLSAVIAATLNDAKNQGFIERGSRLDPSGTTLKDDAGSSGGSCGSCSGSHFCCIGNRGGGGGDGRACLAIMALALALITLVGALSVACLAGNSTREAGRQGLGLGESNEVDASDLPSRKLPLDAVKEMRQLMFAERSVAAVGQWGIAVSFIFLTIALVSYAHWKVTVDNGVLDPKVITWAKRGLYSMIAGVGLCALNSILYHIYSKRQILEKEKELRKWEESIIDSFKANQIDGPVVLEEDSSRNDEEAALEVGVGPEDEVE